MTSHKADNHCPSLECLLLQAPKEAGGKPLSDQLLPPFVIVDDKDAPVGAVQDGDAVIIFNFRADRVVEISKALEYEKFDKFERKKFPKVSSFYSSLIPNEHIFLAKSKS